MKHFIGLLMDAADGLLTILDLEELPGTRTWKHTMILVSNLQHVIRESYYLRWCFEWICIISKEKFDIKLKLSIQCMNMNRQRLVWSVSFLHLLDIADIRK